MRNMATVQQDNQTQQTLRLFVVGESDSDPDTWGDGWSLVIAADANQAAAEARRPRASVAEIDMTKPQWLLLKISTD